MKRPAYRLLDVLVADDVRQENTGKLIVLGMYLGSIVVAKLPTVIPTLAFVTKWWSQNGSLPAGMYKIIDPTGKTIQEIRNVAFKSEPPAPLLTAVNKFTPVRLNLSGVYKWTFTPDRGRQRKLAEFALIVRDQAVPGEGAELPARGAQA